MKHSFWISMVIASLSLGLPNQAGAQQQTAEPTVHVIAIYNIAPGMHAEFLKWMAAQEAIAREAGAAAPKWYGHLDGASWDFLSIAEEREGPEQDAIEARIEALAKERGVAGGFAAGLEFRRFVSSHTDTHALGPFTAQELVQEAGASR